MAGIGFELRKLMQRDTLLGLMQTYTYAGIISSGPWVLSILGILVIGVMSFSVVIPDILITQFQVSVTWLIALSLILTGFVQLAFTRYTADQHFGKHDDTILPAFNGLLLFQTALSGLLGALAVIFLFPEQSVMYRLLMLSGFVVICDIWLAAIFLSSMKHYKAILVIFAIGYGIAVSAALLMRPFGLEGLLGGFVLGQFVLLIGMITLILRNYPSSKFISARFFTRKDIYFTMVGTGLFYNLGYWIDKFMFWLHPATGAQVIGPLHSSLIYDIPVFMAYLSIIPAMAVFLVKMETDFVEYYNRFYDAVREGSSLEYIETMRNEMVYIVQQGIYQIIKVQTIAALVLYIAAPVILDYLNISELYLPLLFVNLVSAGLQVVFLAVLNVFFYLDKRWETFFLTGAFVLLNGVFTAVTLALGPKFYGYGFAVALLLVNMAAFWVLNRKLDQLEFDTFMMQRGH